MTEAFQLPTADAIIRQGGWHPRYARVLLIEHDEDDAVVLFGVWGLIHAADSARPGELPEVKAFRPGAPDTEP